MKELVSNCVGCPPELGCMGAGCPHNYEAYYCDECGESDDLYYYDGKELCIECIKKRLEKVE